MEESDFRLRRKIDNTGINASVSLGTYYTESGGPVVGGGLFSLDFYIDPSNYYSREWVSHDYKNAEKIDKLRDGIVSAIRGAVTRQVETLGATKYAMHADNQGLSYSIPPSALTGFKKVFLGVFEKALEENKTQITELERMIASEQKRTAVSEITGYSKLTKR